MPSVTLNKQVVMKLIGKKLSDERLKHAISYLGTDLESVENNQIDVEMFPNRPDLLSEQGLARAVSSFIGEKTGLREYPLASSGKKVIIGKSVAPVRPYTACAIVEGMSFDDEKIKEIIQIQEKLHITFGRNRKKAAIGIYPLEKITFPVRFVGRKPQDIRFRPLESPREMTGLQILSQHPTGREYGYLLERHEVFPFFIDANDQVLSMPPIINSHEVGKISEQTQDVFIECSGHDLRVLKQCLNMIVTAMADMGGNIKTVTVEMQNKTYTTPDLRPHEMNIEYSYVDKVLGIGTDQTTICRLLEHMGYGIKKKNSSSLTALIPAWRSDILHPIDLVEDIAIAYGYDHFTPEIPQAATIAAESPMQILQKKLADLIVGLGITEASAFIISSSETENDRMCLEEELITLKNPSTKEYDCLRPWLVPSLLDTLKLNKRHEYPQNIFLTGRCAHATKKQPGYKEDERIAVALCADKVTYTDIKQVLDTLMQQIGVSAIQVEPIVHPSFINGRAGTILAKGEEIGVIGEIDPQVLTNFELEMPVAVLEINLEKLLPLIG
ncbi:MAG: phenylalanine--tRNA ligase subunit beta [Nanoarchaeota archaeon]